MSSCLRSSLFATSQLVSSLGMTGHDYVIGRDSLMRKAPGTELLVENPDGFTVLDVMRNATLTAGEVCTIGCLYLSAGSIGTRRSGSIRQNGPQEFEVGRMVSVTSARPPRADTAGQLIADWNADLSGGKGRLYV
jgi:hypothetical protein